MNNVGARPWPSSQASRKKLNIALEGGHDEIVRGGGPPSNRDRRSSDRQWV
jgi:hypothetical protein